ncbi:MAG: hypothetical protein ACI9NC_004923, partial [Verrucomicrobiales bacterium]
LKPFGIVADGGVESNICEITMLRNRGREPDRGRSRGNLQPDR